jgi:predicted dinucleotide-binding enzyme
MFIAGDDDAAKGTVTALLEETGWDVADLGGIEASRYLEPMSLAWVAYGFRTGGWQHAFKLLHP